MNFKKDILTVLDSLKKKGIDRSAVEAELGYSANYIDQILSKGGNKVVLRRLNELLQKDIANATVDAGKQISENIDEILELKAGVEVLKAIVSAFAAEKKGSSVAKERLEIEKICEEQYGLFFSEWKRKHR